MEKTTSIKFFWNGIKINGERKLIKCFYSLDNRHDGLECVTIYARGYSDHLPGDMFPVENDTDSMTDYFETDRADLFPGHPLYPYARYAAMKGKARGIDKRISEKKLLIATLEDRYNDPLTVFYARPSAATIEFHRVELSSMEKIKADFDAMKDPGRPTAADVEAVHALNLAAETARLAAEEEKRQKEQEEVLLMTNTGRVYIEEVAAAHPIKEGAPVVTIEWSEHPAFYSWEDGELKLSVAAAEIILTHYDELRAEQNRASGRGGYDKTKFAIEYTDAKGEASSYTGRYDLGDNEGGLIAHIRASSESKLRPGHFHDEEAAYRISALADLLDGHTAAGRIVSVSLAPWVEKAVTARRKAAQERMESTLAMVDMLTDDQLTAAVFATPKDTPDVARFFLQRLAQRDEKKALAAFKAWQNGAGMEALDEI